MTKKKVMKDRHQGDSKPDFEVEDEFLGEQSTEEYDDEELESTDGFAQNLSDDVDSVQEAKTRIKNDPNAATQGSTQRVRKHHGATKDDPTRMTSSTPQSEKNDLEPGTIVEKKAKFADGIVVRKKVADVIEDAEYYPEGRDVHGS